MPDQPNTERSPKQILDEPWVSLKDAKNKNITWIFLHVDVIGHSRLFVENMALAELQTSHSLLKDFRDHVVRSSIPDYDEEFEWDWAGDGGIFAFRSDELGLHTTEKVVLVAERIRNELREWNERREVPGHRFDIRLVLTRGAAYFYPEKALRTGRALNLSAKVRIPGDRTSIVITDSVHRDLQKTLRAQFRRVEPIEAVDEAIFVYAPALVDGLQEALNNEAQQGDPMQAAHLAYRLGVLHFGMGDRSPAIAAFQRAETLLAREKHPHRYYHRTLRAFYRLWGEVAEATREPMLARGDGNDRRAFLRHLASEPSLRAAIGERWQFLHEMEFCIEQLDILARHPVADPTGLTTMQICLLLERFGYPRSWHGSAISKRIKRIREELRATEADPNQKYDAGTMDKGCSLCTAVAASCLILDNDRDPNVQHMIRWLISKKSQRFSTRSRCYESRVGEEQHALHYAASVLQALIDYDKDHGGIRDVIDVFFSGPIYTEDLPKHWIRYLHIPYFDLACYIFSAFARTIVACSEPKTVGLTDLRRQMLANGLEAFAKRLVAEANEAECDPERIYAARENLGSLALGLLISVPNDTDTVLMFEGIRALIAKVASEDDLDPVEQRTTTIDSNFDRMWRMFDGWLLQWECALIARERGLPIPAVLAHLFPAV